MSIDDKLDVLRNQVEQTLQPDAQRQLREAGVVGLLSVFPIGGAVIQNLLMVRAQRYVLDRFLEMLEEMRRRLDEIKNSIPDEEYFGSGEFQVLLALAIEQLQTTKDETKRQALATALANSGSQNFVNDSSKEQYVRTLRDLSPQDLKLLKDNDLYGWGPFVRGNRAYKPEELSSLSRLESLGLIYETLTLPEFRMNSTPKTMQDVNRAIGEFVKQKPVRIYHISAFGERFLEFLSAK